MKVIRAHDGRSIAVNQPLSQFSTLDDLLDCFSLATEIPSDAIICMTSDGSQLKDELVREIAQQEQERQSRSISASAQGRAQEQSEFYVFNRDFLYTDAQALAAELAEAPELQAAAGELEIVHPPTPKSLEALVTWSGSIVNHLAAHEVKSRDLVDHVDSMLRSTQVALLNLQSHSESIRKGADALAELAATELTRMQGLLDGHERDLQILGMVSIHPRLLSSGGSGNVGASGSTSKPTNAKERNLGDYVSRVKMNAVAEACTKVYTELRERITALEEARQQLDHDVQALTDEVRGTDIQPSTDTHQEASEALARASDLFRFVDANCSPNDQGWPATDKLDEATYEEVGRATDELLLLDDVGRQSVLRLTQDRNDMLARCIELLQDISSLQSEFADLGSNLAAVDADLHSNKVDGFKHLHRLKNMLWAYAATVLEVVRRREFARHFLSKSQTLAELMAKLSATERKRRQQYRSDVFGQLPWEVKGMEEMAPSLEITTTRTGGDGVAELGREDLEALLQLLDAVDQRLSEDGHNGPEQGASPVQEVKAALQRLMAILDDWEDEFLYLVHTQLIGDGDGVDGDNSEAADDSGSDTSVRARARQRGKWKRLKATPAPPDRAEVEALERQLQEERSAHARDAEAAATTHRSEIASLKQQLEEARKELDSERSKNADLRASSKATENELNIVKADLDLEKERRLNMADEVSHLRTGLEEARRAEATARQEAIEESDHANEVEAHLHEMQIELDEARAARLDASNRIEALLGEGSSAEQELRAAQQRIDELTEQVSAAHAETNRVRESIAEIEAAKERQIRSHRAEADGDRAILEEKVRALEHDLHDQRVRAKRAEDGRKPDHEAIELLKGQLRAADDAHEEIVKEMEQAKELAEQAEAARKDLEVSRQQLLDVARPLLARSHQLRKAVRAMPALSSSSKSASAATAATKTNGNLVHRSMANSGSMAMSVVSEAERQAAMEAFEAEAESADFDVTMEALRVFEPSEAFDEVKGKLDSLTTLIRKWQKAYKSSNEKTQKALAAAREKIAFRNFQAGDLALFLPTRNSTAKPWAAFNISFPHFFLRATGQLAEQLKTKEWIVARIVAITDQVATNGQREDGTDGNPFQLAEGVRFYLLDVESWNASNPTQPALRSRKSAAAITSGSTAEGSRKDRMSERRKSDILPSRSVAEEAGQASGDKDQMPSVGADDRAKEGDGHEGRTDKDRKAPYRRASEGDRPSAPGGLSAIDDDDEQNDHSGTPPMMTPDGSPPRPTPQAPSAPTPARSERTRRATAAGPQTPGDGGALMSPPASSERHPRSYDVHATSLSQIAANAVSPTRSTVGPSALTRAIRATSPASLRGNGTAASWASRPTEEGHPEAGGMHLSAAAATLEARDEGSRHGMGISGSSFGGHAMQGNGHGFADGVAGSSTSGSDSKRSAIIERAAAAPAFGRGSGRCTRYESRRHAGGLGSAPASQTTRLIEQTMSKSSEPGPAPANPFSQSPSGANLSTSLANDRSGPQRKTTLSQRIDATPEDAGAAVKSDSKAAGATGVTIASPPAPPKIHRWTDPAVPAAIPARPSRRESHTGRTSGFSITSSPSTGTMGSPRGLASSLAGPPPEPTAKLSTEQATGRSTLSTSQDERSGAGPSPLSGSSRPTLMPGTERSRTISSSGGGGGGGGGGFLSQTLGRFSSSSIGDGGRSAAAAAVSGVGVGGAGTSPRSSRKSRPSLDAVLHARPASESQSSPRASQQQPPLSSGSDAAATPTSAAGPVPPPPPPPASDAGSTSSAASQMLRRVGGFL